MLAQATFLRHDDSRQNLLVIEKQPSCRLFRLRKLPHSRGQRTDPGCFRCIRHRGPKRGSPQKNSPAAALACGRGFLGLYPVLPGAFYRLGFRVLRGSRPTTRLMVSDCRGSAGHGLRGKRSLPDTYARRGSNDSRSLKGLSGGVMPRSSVGCSCCLPNSHSSVCGASQTAFRLEDRHGAIGSGDG